MELNTLDILKKRELKTLPPHFAKIRISDNERYDYNVSDWIRSKLSGRFCVVSYPAVDSNKRFKTVTIAGFEKQKELTYFMLACPYLRRN